MIGGNRHKLLHKILTDQKAKFCCHHRKIHQEKHTRTMLAYRFKLCRVSRVKHWTIIIHGNKHKLLHKILTDQSAKLCYHHRKIHQEKHRRTMLAYKFKLCRVGRVKYWTLDLATWLHDIWIESKETNGIYGYCHNN